MKYIKKITKDKINSVSELPTESIGFGETGRTGSQGGRGEIGDNALIDGMFEETSKGLTENMAITYTRSGSELLDFFAQAGAMRNNPSQALELFKKAFAEDRLSAVRALFYLRDVRGGQGERELFRICLEWIGSYHPGIFQKIAYLVPEYGRWDDLFFDDKTCFDIIDKQLQLDVKSETPSLLAKWLPTANASSRNTRAKAALFASKLGLELSFYRKMIRNLRQKIKTVEELMSANRWSDINYSAVPSQASRIYKNSFSKHDPERYSAFVEKAKKGKEKINAATLYPYQIYKSAVYDYSETLEALWNQLPDYTRGNNALVVADVSGSMSGDPISVSVSLALYFAERNKGQFKDHFITFSGSPKLQRIKGESLLDKMNSISRSEWEMNTDLQAVFDLILGVAIKNSVSEKEMPSTIYIISDMEFDEACKEETNYDSIKRKYEEAGYKLPTVVFWNVNARSGMNLPVMSKQDNVSLVSGFSPVIFKFAVEGKNPTEVMMSVINSERYLKILF